jgi:DNA-directed RNA polymerase specialized sigma24 family protein
MTLLLWASGRREVGELLVELSVMEQRYQAVLAVIQDGWKVTEVAARLGVSRQSVHNWITRYERGGRRPRRSLASSSLLSPPGRRGDGGSDL